MNRSTPANPPSAVRRARIGVGIPAPTLAIAPFISNRSSPLPTRITRPGDRKSTRLNSSHVAISYAVFCLKKKKHPENNYLRSRCIFHDIQFLSSLFCSRPHARLKHLPSTILPTRLTPPRHQFSSTQTNPI